MPLGAWIKHVLHSPPAQTSDRKELLQQAELDLLCNVYAYVWFLDTNVQSLSCKNLQQCHVLQCIWFHKGYIIK